MSAPTETSEPVAAVTDAPRLRALHDTGLLDSPPERAFDRLTEFATRLLDVPVALVSLVDEDRQFFKSMLGLTTAPWAERRETPLTHSFCQHVVATSQPLIVRDARDDERLCDNLAIDDLGVVAYLGVPLFTPSGHAIGTLCAIDETPHTWSDDDVAVLSELAEAAMTEIALREHLRERTRAEEALRALNEALEERVRDRTAELATTYENLRQLNEELQNFAYIASHDLQEPLRKISSFAGLFAEDYGDTLDETGAKYLDRIRHSAVRMSHLLRDLLKYSRVFTHGSDFVTVELDDLAAEVTKELQFTIEDAEATVTVEPLPTLEADPRQLRQLLLNLLSNALRFREEDVPPTICVRCETDANATPPVCHLVVEDDGIGFDPKYADRIFEPFERLHGRKYPGTGMGLAICKRIVERHRGQIVVEGEPGEGTTVHVTLPLRQYPE
ncbi:MAG: GAF domain-containing protein [Bacteroidetes bacterium]|jgi:signal transduction histidine kinase|nr:GAF domain-containing protein [Bacteroidota bacterium]